MFSLTKEKNDQDAEDKKLNKKLKVLKTTILTFISLLLFTKIVVLISGPDTILKSNYFSDTEILILVINFFYTVLWIMVALFIFYSNDVKNDKLTAYLKKICYSIFVLFFLDFILEGIVYLTTIGEYMSFSVTPKEMKFAETAQDSYIMVLAIIMITVFLAIFFIVFIVKRKLRILRYIEVLTLILLLSIAYLMNFYTGSIIGWNESLIYLLHLFSFNYGYTGFIFLIILAVSIITNSGIVLLFSLKEFYISEQQLKNKIINLVKIGFSASCLLSFMAIWPYIYVWF